MLRYGARDIVSTFPEISSKIALMTSETEFEPDNRSDAHIDADGQDSSMPADPLIGLLVDDRYRIQARLARGGMATVYVAHDERLDRPVALKVMHPHLAESADFVARFRREARASARIVSPGVVSVFDQGVIHGQGFLVMELIDGTNLRALLQAQGAFTVSQSLQYTQDILEALRAAHRVGVIHRDIKPENVLVPSEGPVRVTDFGLARAASEVSMSTTGSMLGTVAYMAPEIATSGVCDARTDIYAVGIMLYEMLTGAVPWQGETAMQMAYHHVNDSVPLPSEFEPWIPRELDDLVAALAAKDPEDRPLDAQEALDLLLRARASIPAEIAGKRAEIEAAEEDGEHKTAALGLVELTAPLPAQKLPATSQAIVHVSGGVTQVAHRKTRRSRFGKLAALIVSLLIVGVIGGLWWWHEYGPGSYITMPVTDGRTVTDVENDLRTLHLKFQEREDFSDTVQTGIVISTTPGSQDRVHKRAEVLVVVSKGVDMRTAPNLKGMATDAAKNALTTSGLAVGNVTEDWSEDVEKGKIISQSVEAGSSIRHDTKVDFVVSKGREPLSVPALGGKSAEEVRQTLESMGLVPEATEAFSSTVAQGTVISQETAAGTTLHRGDKVQYTVSKGPETVEVPTVQGLQESQARSALEAAGLQVRVERFMGGLFGTVRSSNPAAGTVVPRGTTVTLTIV